MLSVHLISWLQAKPVRSIWSILISYNFLNRWRWFYLHRNSKKKNWFVLLGNNCNLNTGDYHIQKKNGFSEFFTSGLWFQPPLTGKLCPFLNKAEGGLLIASAYRVICTYLSAKPLEIMRERDFKGGGVEGVMLHFPRRNCRKVCVCVCFRSMLNCDRMMCFMLISVDTPSFVYSKTVFKVVSVQMDFFL